MRDDLGPESECSHNWISRLGEAPDVSQAAGGRSGLVAHGQIRCDLKLGQPVVMPVPPQALQPCWPEVPVP
jgi:hypothetical protein